ncbi:hypothetical protein L1987_79490 [Smallanthus sonchifolius]|uniref:Uncharacterized protein n=1 Tax=Smallanthus sonchifolius TaxID=185202 RepID=A0ACB8ZFV0_9ASTR|nr:hypothetical protein L1987_79490 [Smallanthus sonchifolius]
MQNDEVIWQVLRHKHCSFMAKITAGIFCRNPYNLTGVCNRSSCPLANSRYATVRDHEGVFYLYMKTIERAHMPNKLWERVKLPRNYEKALEIIDNNLMYWPKFLVHKAKQRLTKMTQMRIRMRKLALKTREKIMTTPRKEKKREARREEKAERAAILEKNIEKELVERVKKGMYGGLYNYNTKAFENFIDELEGQNQEEERENVVYVDLEDELEEEDDMEDFSRLPTEGADLDDDNDMMDDDDDDDESEKVVVDRKRGRADSKYSLKKKEKDAKKKGRVLVEVEHEETDGKQKAILQYYKDGGLRPFSQPEKKMEDIVKIDGDGDGDEVNLEVVRILKKASEEVVDRVELSGHQLKFLPEEFGKLASLVHLNLSNNHLQVLPDSIAGLLKLEELDVSSNLLESLPDSIGLLTTLKVLNVSSNKLNTLPESIAFCKSLVELYASFNNLKFLPTNFGYGLTNLKTLSIGLNEIRFLPTTISELESLKYLDAHFNKLHGLPSSIGKLMNLETLNLSSNFSNLTELPDTITDLANLKELDVSNNQIQVLPESFGQLQNLTKLNLDQNPLVIPPMEIVIQGTEAVKGFMIKWRLENIAAEEQRRLVEGNAGNQGGWLTWGTNMVNSYFGQGKSAGSKDSYLDQLL